MSSTRCRWLGGVALLLSIAACEGEPEQRLPSQNETDRRYLIDRLALVCDGRIYPQAAAYEESPGSHPTAVVRAYGKGEWRPVPAAYEPKSLEEAQLVACARDGKSDRSVDITVFRTKDGVQIGAFQLELKSGGDSGKKQEIADAVKPFAEGAPPANAKPAASGAASARPAVDH